MTETHVHTVRLGPGTCSICGLTLSSVEAVDPREGLMPSRRIYRSELMELIQNARAASPDSRELDGRVDRLKSAAAKQPEETDRISWEGADALMSLLDYAYTHGVRLQ